MSENRCVVVVGSQWGDEGKGKVVDVLAESALWVTVVLDQLPCFLGVPNCD